MPAANPVHSLSRVRGRAGVGVSPHAQMLERLASVTPLTLYPRSPHRGIPHMAGSIPPAFVQGCLPNAPVP